MNKSDKVDKFVYFGFPGSVQGTCGGVGCVCVCVLLLALFGPFGFVTWLQLVLEGSGPYTWWAPPEQPVKFGSHHYQILQ